MNKIEQKIKYTKSPSYSTIGIHGVYGGVTPSVKLSINFYTEGTHVPETSTLEADEVTGQFYREIPGEELMALREIVAGVTMDLETAKSIHIWLGQKIKDMDNILTEFTSKQGG